MEEREAARGAATAPERLTLIGAGAVGLVLGAHLARAGRDVTFVVRRSEVARRIESEGVGVEDLSSGESWRARARAFVPFDRLAGEATGPILICLRAPDTPALAPKLAAHVPAALVVSAQNDVDNEQALARHFRHVAGLVVRQTCTRAGDTTVRTLGAGRLVLGTHPLGVDAETRGLGAALADAGFQVALSEHIAEDKWLKLCVNATSAVNALVRREDHEHPAFPALKVALLEEARDVLRAAGIVARACDGGDRSLDEEIDHQRHAVARGTSARRLPLYNACWAALDDPRRPLEADAYHARIVRLGRAHGVATPAHEVLHAAVQDAWARATGPERLGAEPLLARVHEAAGR